MAALQTLSSCALVLLLLLAPHACLAAATTTLQVKCEKYAAGTQSAYDFCMRTLQADRASATADARGLAAIAARIGRAKAIATSATIAGWMDSPTVPAPRRDCLAACAVEYGVAVRRLGRAAKDAASGADTGGLQEAQALLAEVYGVSTRCDAACKAVGQGSPLSAEDRELDNVVELAISILPVPPSPKRG